MPEADGPQLQQKLKQEVFEPEGHELVSVGGISENQDIDMFLLALPVGQIQMLSSFWTSYAGPPMKFCLQLFHHPVAMFLEPAQRGLPQAWKAEVCRHLHLQGVEIPLPTSANQCQCNGSCIKCHTATLQAGLEALSVGIVHVGQSGRKIPLQLFQNIFNMAQAMREGAALTLGFKRKAPFGA